MSKAVVQYAAEVWGSSEASDCTLRFYVESTGEPGGQATGAGSGAQRAFVGEPLHGHTFILRGCSRRLRALMMRWKDVSGVGGSAAAVGSGGGGGGDSGGIGASLPELHVLLNATADLQPALEVLEFCYKSSLRSQRVRELLRVRHQASYLQVLDCVAACDAKLLALAEGLVPTTHTSTLIAIFDAHELFPDPELEPGFQPVLAAITTALMVHFGCAYTILGSAQLRQVWLELPMVMVEMVLSSAELKTDCESTVLVLALRWMGRHIIPLLHGDSSRRQLLRHVRLCQLSRPYLHVLLPQLPWLNLPLLEYGLLTAYAAASPAERASLGWSGRTDCDWFHGPRPASKVVSGKLVLPWFIQRDSLLSFLRESSTSTRARSRGSGAGGAGIGGLGAGTAPAITAAGWDGTRPGTQQHGGSKSSWRACWLVLGSKDEDKRWLDGVYYRGFSWRAQLAWSPQHPDEARLCLAAYEPVGNEHELHGSLRQHARGSINVRAHVRLQRAGGARDILFGEVGPHVPIPIRDFRDALPSASRAVTVLKLPLRRSSELPAGGSAAVEAAADPLWAWGAYLQKNGRMGGDLEFRPVAESGAAMAEQYELPPSFLADLFVDGGDSEEDEPEWDYGEQTTEETEDSQLWSGEEEEDEEAEEGEEEESEWTDEEEVASGDADEEEEEQGEAEGEESDDEQDEESKAGVQEAGVRGAGVDLGAQEEAENGIADIGAAVAGVEE